MYVASHDINAQHKETEKCFNCSTDASRQLVALVASRKPCIEGSSLCQTLVSVECNVAVQKGLSCRIEGSRQLGSTGRSTDISGQYWRPLARKGQLYYLQTRKSGLSVNHQCYRYTRCGLCPAICTWQPPHLRSAPHTCTWQPHQHPSIQVKHPLTCVMAIAKHNA
eukprot:1149303-Pelagomonas_calceolata.AAC.3